MILKVLLNLTFNQLNQSNQKLMVWNREIGLEWTQVFRIPFYKTQSLIKIRKK